MTEATPRRTIAFKLRQLIDQFYAIEHSMEVFHRKGDQGQLERAAKNYADMLRHVDRLGDMIAEARDTQRADRDRAPQTA